MALISTLILGTYFAVKREKLSSFKVWSIPILLFTGLLVMKALHSHAYGLQFKGIAVVMDFLHLFARHYGLAVYHQLFFFYVKRMISGLSIGMQLSVFHRGQQVLLS